MTRDEILEASARIFSLKGFHAASMADIADAVSLQKASLYHHFESKQEILLALLNRALDVITIRLEEVTALSLSPENKLRQAIITYLQVLADFQELSSVLLLEYRSLDPELRSQHIPRRDRFERLWRDLIQQGQEDGIFNCKDPSLTARALLGVMNWTITWYRKDGPQPVEAIANQFTELFLHGLMTNSHPLDASGASSE